MVRWKKQKISKLSGNSYSKKNSCYFCDFCQICYFSYTFLIAVFFKSFFLLKLRKQFASKFLLTRSILDESAKKCTFMLIARSRVCRATPAQSPQNIILCYHTL